MSDFVGRDNFDLEFGSGAADTIMIDVGSNDRGAPLLRYCASRKPTGTQTLESDRPLFQGIRTVFFQKAGFIPCKTPNAVTGAGSPPPP